MAKFAFMVMPFGRKPTQVEPGKGPTEVNFNTLWDRAFFPMLVELGYSPIRADQDTGALIIHQMLERLYFSDLVLVDLTAPNCNVYYEMGVRHAMQLNGCVLLSSDWSRPMFDVAQMRTVHYPLPAGEVTDEMATAVRAAITPRIKEMRDGTSPVHQALPGYPGNVKVKSASGLEEMVSVLARFQADIRAARLTPHAQRIARFEALREQYSGYPTVPGIALALLRLLVDAIYKPEQWQLVLDYEKGLDPRLACDAYVMEQHALALGKLGRTKEAITELIALIEVAGSTSERQGLLGGRYKELWRKAAIEGNPSDATYWLDRAIEHYERGMYADLNDFYPASNLARLYRVRNEVGDSRRAQIALHVAHAGCQRALDRNSMDRWVRPTLLSLQFDLPDADKAAELVHAIKREGAALWMLDAVINDARISIGQAGDEAVRVHLSDVLTELENISSAHESNRV